MKSLIKTKYFPGQMAAKKEIVSLERAISGLLEEGSRLFFQEGRGTINLYNGLPSVNVMYSFDERGIVKRWKGSYPGGDPVTDVAIISNGEFFGWLHDQPWKIKEEIYRSLVEYIRTPPKRSKSEFPVADLLNV